MRDEELYMHSKNMIAMDIHRVSVDQIIALKGVCAYVSCSKCPLDGEISNGYKCGGIPTCYTEALRWNKDHKIPKKTVVNVCRAPEDKRTETKLSYSERRKMNRKESIQKIKIEA